MSDQLTPDAPAPTAVEPERPHGWSRWRRTVLQAVVILALFAAAGAA